MLILEFSGKVPKWYVKFPTDEYLTLEEFLDRSPGEEVRVKAAIEGRLALPAQ